MRSQFPLTKLVHELSKLPGIGEKTAQRLAFYILRSSHSDVRQLSEAIREVKEKMVLCTICFDFTDTDPCSLCTSPQRDTQILCIVEEPQDKMAIEKSGVFDGRYHVLHGALSPLDGIGPDQLKIAALSQRLQREKIEEIILATNPSVEGETTALYLVKLLKPMAFKITRIAHGIPMGGDLEYMDTLTIGNALKNRVVL